MEQMPPRKMICAPRSVRRRGEPRRSTIVAERTSGLSLMRQPVRPARERLPLPRGLRLSKNRWLLAPRRGCASLSSRTWWRGPEPRAELLALISRSPQIISAIFAARDSVGLSWSAVLVRSAMTFSIDRSPRGSRRRDISPPYKLVASLKCASGAYLDVTRPKQYWLKLYMKSPGPRRPLTELKALHLTADNG
jgi:hypothetical protein